MRNRHLPFILGVTCGVAMVLTLTAVLNHVGRSKLDAEGTPLQLSPVSLATSWQPSEQPLYFVTGDSISATLWRRERNGSLTCISVNECRQPQGE